MLNAMLRARRGIYGKALIGVSLAGATLCALAGTGLPSDSHGHTHAVTSIPGAFLAFAAAGMLLSGRRRPTMHSVIAGLGLVLVLAVTFFAFQTALHSVHHLGDADAERECSVFGAADHLSGAPIPAATVEVPAISTEDAVPVGITWLLPQQPIRPAAGRAPPVPVLA